MGNLHDDIAIACMGFKVLIAQVPDRCTEGVAVFFEQDCPEA
jgi:hypothetical protein